MGGQPYRRWREPARDESGLPSGLTGPVDIPDPPPPPKLPWRQRLRNGWKSVVATAAGLPRVLRLCWRASAWATVMLAALTVVVGLVPALTASTARLLVDAVVHTVAIRVAHQPDRAVLTLPIPGSPRFGGLTGTEVVFWLAITQFAVSALSALLSAIQSIVQRILSDRLSLTVQTMIVEQASRLELAFFERSESYDLLQRAAGQAATRPFNTLTTFFGLMQTVVTFVSMIGLLISLNPLLGVIVLVAPIPAFIVDTRYGMRTYLRTRWTSPVTRRINYIAQLLTTDTAAKEIRIFGLGPYLVERYRLLSANLAKRLREIAIRRQLAEFVWDMLGVLARSASYLYVALQAAAGRLTLGDLTLYGTAASSVQGGVSGILNSLTSMYENNLYIDDLYRLLATPAEEDLQAERRDAATAAILQFAAQRGPADEDGGPASSAPGVAPVAGAATPVSRPTAVAVFVPTPLPVPVRGEICFEGVSFRYPGTDEAALTDVDFVVRPGETIAIVGRNGAGKSTLVKLICRLYAPDAGRILVDGVDIADVDPTVLRSQIGAVFQDHVSFQATAAENIALGELTALDDRVRIERAGEAGGADGFVRALPHGYDTSLGRWFRGGVNLSGGEWQKLALARGFMRDARIIILDEPSAALDARAEHDLFTRLRALASGRTAFYISHRFSTVRQADRIIFLERGRITESGTHHELMALDGRYAELFTLQAAAYVDDPASAGSGGYPGPPDGMRGAGRPRGPGGPGGPTRLRSRDSKPEL
jgi:ATP-binding cassette subfamily B protein